MTQQLRGVAMGRSRVKTAGLLLLSALGALAGVTIEPGDDGWHVTDERHRRGRE